MAAEKRTEYRVVWKREGKSRRVRIYQTRTGAIAFLDVLRTSHPDEPPVDEGWSDSDYERWERMTAPFAEPPRLQISHASPWVDCQSDEGEAG